MLIALNTLVRRHRRRVLPALGVFALAGAMLVAHGSFGGHTGHAAHAMSATVDTAPAADVLAVCLAVAETAAVAFGLPAAIGAWRFARVTFGAPLMCDAARSPVPAHHGAGAARAGPADLQVFLR